MFSNTDVQIIPASQTCLPTELVEIVISYAWSIPMYARDRTKLFASFSLVSRSWFSMLIRTILRDVHIPCPLSADDYLDLIRERKTPRTDKFRWMQDTSLIANDLCRSLTFHVEHDAHRTSADVHESVMLRSAGDVSANAISTAMYMISTGKYLPNLRCVSIHYVNWGFDDIFERGRFVFFPDQVTHLDITFAFGNVFLEALGRTLRDHHRRHWREGFKAPSVRHLSIFGAPATFVSEMLARCPEVEALDTDDFECLTQLLALPRKLNTLILYPHQKKLDRVEMIKRVFGKAHGVGNLGRLCENMELLEHCGRSEAVSREKERRCGPRGLLQAS